MRVLSSVLLLVAALSAAPPSARHDTELWRDVEVIRTAHGVPHLRATNLRAAGYALAWVMSEDYGARTAMRSARIPMSPLYHGLPLPSTMRALRISRS